MAVITTLMNLSGTNGARILAVFPIPAISHQTVYRALMKELHSRGHEIVIVTSFPMRDQNLVNYTEIDISNIVGLWKNNIDYHKSKEYELSLYQLMINVSKIFKEICCKILGSPEVLSLIRNGYKNGSFDLVITSWLVNPCVTGFAYHFSAPLLGISTLGLIYSGHNSIGNPTHPVYFTEAFNPYLKNPTFWQKVNRLAYYVWNMWYWHAYVVQPQDRIARRYFGENMPHLQELHDNVSLVFTALQTSHHCAVPQVPALIELGPIHLKEAKPLPKVGLFLIIYFNNFWLCTGKVLVYLILNLATLGELFCLLLLVTMPYPRVSLLTYLHMYHNCWYIYKTVVFTDVGHPQLIAKRMTMMIRSSHN